MKFRIMIILQIVFTLSLLSACSETTDELIQTEASVTPSVEENKSLKTETESLDGYYKISSRYYGAEDGTNIFDLFRSDDGLERMKDFYIDLRTLDYTEFHLQSLTHVGYFDGTQKFTEPYPVNVESDGEYTTVLQTLMIGDMLYSGLGDYIASGQNFTEDDFLVTEPEQTVGIILGSAYKELYNIGDTLPLSLADKMINTEVIGFFKEGTSIFWGNMEIAFDTRIIFPMYEITYEATDDTDRMYQNIFYSLKIEGHVSAEKGIIEQIDEMAENHGILYGADEYLVEISGF